MDIFSGIEGQEQALGVLNRAIKTGNINHAYLFAGPPSTGKTTCAEAFSQALLLQGDPSGQTYLKEGIHPDLMVCERMEKKTLIGIEQITRELEPWIQMKPYRASFRVVVIKEAHLLSPTAANALLKTLEEPPAYAVIILVSDENNLMETIISRCQLIRFSPLSDAVVKKLLIQQGVEQEKAALVSRLGQGSLSAALSFAKETSFEETLQTAQGLIQGLASRQEIEIFRAAELMEKNMGMIYFIEILLRDIYIYQETKQASLLLLRENLPVCKQMDRVNTGYVKQALLHIAALKKLLKTSVNALLVCINISYEVQDALK